jgi:hypothetical protein
MRSGRIYLLSRMRTLRESFERWRLNLAVKTKTRLIKHDTESTEADQLY